MSGHWSGSETPERPVERRLRGALAARADGITLADLRPADPPGPHLHRTPLARLRLRRFAWPLAGLATAAAVAVGYVTLASGHDEQRPLPANSPGPVQPPPTPVPSETPSPVPSPPTRSPSVDGSKSPSEAPPAPNRSKPAAGPVTGAPARGTTSRGPEPPAAIPAR
ncbi:hypothetical protein [Streptomyces violascens]|uniref:Uncharacterized protein n=1 Tax=Streptomyces violascens TaxID=67381 RepID=A0ABQ3QGF0_9ACTN|nr:hypothetical protein [Streptomyces violascens]GGT89464.1 hypothetical protein GCM10010289_06900 [Streptomyces violascens]GHI36355.1 hypothetical protein Sviol_07630 [Streptomyces violascens]